MSANQNQPLRPINNNVLPEQKSNVIDLDLCPWRYPEEVIKKFNEDQEKESRKFRMPDSWSKWQNKKHYSNLN